MRTSSAKLLMLAVALLAAGFAHEILATSSFTQQPASQDPAVNIQTGGGRSNDGNAVIVSVDRTRVRVGELVVFTLTPAAVVLNPRYAVTVDFGDGNRRQVRSTQVRYRYAATGHYKVYASVVGSERYSDPDPKDPVGIGVPRVTLIVDPSRTTAGQSVNFRAQLSSSYPNLRYRFSFGDGSSTEWQTSADARHTFQSVGTYAAFVDIGSGVGSIKPLGGSVRQKVSVTALPLGPVGLVANPSSVATGIPVTLTARVASTDPSVRYRFGFGDRTPAGVWQSSSQTTHAYSTAGNFAPYVEIGLASNGSPTPVASARTSIQITKAAVGPEGPGGNKTNSKGSGGDDSSNSGSSQSSTGSRSSPSPASSPLTGGASSTPSRAEDGSLVLDDRQRNARSNWWWLVLALLLLPIGYWLWKWVVGPSAIVAVHPDLGKAEVGAGATGFSIDSEILLRPDVSNAKYDVAMTEPVVKNLRRENG